MTYLIVMPVKFYSSVFMTERKLMVSDLPYSNKKIRKYFLFPPVRAPELTRTQDIARLDREGHGGAEDHQRMGGRLDFLTLFVI